MPPPQPVPHPRCPLPRFPYVLLDAGETLIGPRRSYGAVYAEVLGELGFAADAVRLEAAIRSTAGELQRGLAPGADRYARFAGGERAYWQRFVGRVLALSGSTLEDTLIATAVEQLREAFRGPRAWRVYDDVVPVLDALARAGCRLAIVSNWDSRLPHVLESLGLASRFEAIAVSHLEGMEKPDPRLFERALAALGARPEQALHVGNVPELDLAGAAAAHVAARLVDRRGTLEPCYAAWPDLTPLPAEATG